jgi:hypothetical protein
VEDCPVALPLYEGGDPEPRVSDNDCEGVTAPSIFTGINFQTRQVSCTSSLTSSTWDKTQFSCISPDVGEKFPTFVPSALLLPHRSHAISVVSQLKLTHGERGGLVLLETPSLTGRIQTQYAPCYLRSRSAKPWDMGSHRYLDVPYLQSRVIEHKTAQAFPGQPRPRTVKHTVTDPGILANEICTLTLRTEYPAPSGLISHF